MSIGNCLTKLVAAGRISQKAADDALALHEGVQGRLYPEMGPATADAGAALEAARVMTQAAQERKLMAAQQAIRQNEVLNRMQKHPEGMSAGLHSVLVRDNWEAGGKMGNALNIESHAEGITKNLLRKMDGAMEPYASRMAGLRQDTESIWNVVDELFGADTGDAAAKAAAKGFTDATQYAVERVKRAGKPLSVLEDWRLPQMWDTGRVKKFTEKQFLDDLMLEVDAGSMRVMDKHGHGEAPRAAIPGIIQNAYKDITLGRSQGAGAGGFSNQLRVFRFDNPEAYKRLMKKYGMGDGGLFNTMMGHMQGMAKEVAFVEVLGPQYQQNFKKLLDMAKDNDAARVKTWGQKARRSLSVNSPSAVNRTYDALSGNLGVAQSEVLAAFGGGLRNIQTASKLGSAVIAALPGDSMTSILAANYNGIPASAVLARVVKDLTVNREGAEQLARQLNLTAAAVMDTAIGTKRFADEIIGQGFTGKTADFVMRMSGLNTWTEGLKRAFSMEFMGLIGRQAEHKFEALDPMFKGFLERYGFNAGDWDKLRVAPLLEAEGTKFFDVNAVDDQKLADRMMSAIIDERHMAVLEPDARIRGMMTGGQMRGTVIGEAARSITQFKSFPMTFMMTHLMRSAVQDGAWSKAAYTAKLLALTTIGGAVVVQMQSIIAGRDPRDMSTPTFWGEAFIRGGGGGMLADFLNSGVSRGGQGWIEYAIGPGPGAFFATGDFLKNGFTGRSLAEYMKSWTPGSSLWYSKLATDRLIFDNIQAMIDPDYKQSFRRYEKRMKKEFDQTFWWAPGQSSPKESPDLGRMFGGK